MFASSKSPAAAMAIQMHKGCVEITGVGFSFFRRAHNFGTISKTAFMTIITPTYGLM
jgi:hypothetical protein